MNQNKELIKYKITPAGSLGLLALGHVGLNAWRDVKNKQPKLKSDPSSRIKTKK